jgi:hypothetical protein
MWMHAGTCFDLGADVVAAADVGKAQDGGGLGVHALAIVNAWPFDPRHWAADPVSRWRDKLPLALTDSIHVVRRLIKC